MRKKILLASTILILFGFGRWIHNVSAADGKPKSYLVNPLHTTSFFKINHMGISNFYGRFNDISGTIVFDQVNPSNSSFQIKIKANSVDTHNGDRDKHLRGPDFFNSRRYPWITFNSNSVNKTDDHTYAVRGELSMHGVTKPMTVNIEHTGQGKDIRGTQCIGFETTFSVKRSEFGITYMADGLGENVQMTVSIEATLK